MRSTEGKIRRVQAGKNASAAISPSFPAAIDNATVHHAEHQQNRHGAGKSSVAIGSGRKQRVALPFRTKKVQKTQGFQDTYPGQDDIMVVLPSIGLNSPVSVNL